MNTELILKRLTTIKNLYRISMQLSHQPDSSSIFSILSFHDTVEMFCDLAAEHVGVVTKKNEKIYLMDYFEKIPRLKYKESMFKLNERRINIKHKGLLLDKSEVEASRVNATDFLVDNCMEIFEVEFNSISLTSLIADDKIRECLLLAEKHIKENAIMESLAESGKAYAILNDYFKQDVNKDHLWIKPTFRTLNRRGYTQDSYLEEEIIAFEKNTLKQFEVIDRTVERISSIITTISLGVDYRKFIKFKRITPRIVISINGNILISDSNSQSSFSKQDCEFAMNFVLDATLKFEQFEIE